jgi:hypothetical protein
MNKKKLIEKLKDIGWFILGFLIIVIYITIVGMYFLDLFK